MCGLGEKTDSELDYWMRIANDHGERNDSKRVVVEVADLQAHNGCELVDTVYPKSEYTLFISANI